MSRSQRRIVLFFTRGVSLATWDRVGSFDRELALYRRLIDLDYHVTFVTHGDASDLAFASRVHPIVIRCNSRNLAPKTYERWIPWLFAPSLVKADLIKTNQTNGADVALRAARLWRKPLVARSGFLFSYHMEQNFGLESHQYHFARQVEEQVFSAARRIVVTTDEIAKRVREQSVGYAEKLRIIPNYVDTDLFAPRSEEKRYDILFIGRPAPQKNLDSLIEAVEPLSLRCLFIGDGPKRELITQAVERSEGRWQWMPRVPNSELPSYMNSARIYILPSKFEGHPKTLIEAMSAGMAVIGSNTPGIRDEIQDDVTGVVCETDASSIRRAVQDLLAQPDRCDRVGRQARQFVLDHYSLDRVVGMETALYDEVLRKGSGRDR